LSNKNNQQRTGRKLERPPIPVTVPVLVVQVNTAEDNKLDMIWKELQDLKSKVTIIEAKQNPLPTNPLPTNPLPTNPLPTNSLPTNSLPTKPEHSDNDTDAIPGFLVEDDDSTNVTPPSTKTSTDVIPIPKKRDRRRLSQGGGNKHNEEEKLKLEAGSFIGKLTELKKKKKKDKKSEEPKSKKQKTNRRK
jgi:hypothetical protein